MLTITNAKKSKIELRAATVRDFSGGYNTLDSDLNLSSKYSTKMWNIYHTAGGDVRVRYGTELFLDLSLATSTQDVYVVNIEYYNAAVIAVMSNGEVLSILADKTTVRIWDATKAAALPGSPNPWSPTTFASFEQFNGELIICNGVDKPLIVASDLGVDYLQDLATLSNLNVPICRYVTACSRFLVMAGDPVHPNRIHISSRDTSGTWFGDPAPNDGTYIDVGSSLTNASVVKGIRGFRGNLIVAFDEGAIIGTLAIYDEDGGHVPNFDETVKQYGSISHRAMINFGDDMFMMDGVGVPSLKRTTFTGTIRPERVSDLVDLEMATQMSALDLISLEERCFAVYNQREGSFMFFIPNTDRYETTTETTCFQYIYRPGLKATSWARFDDMNWTCGCRSALGSVFFGDYDGKLWLYGSDTYPIYMDKLNDPDFNGGEGAGVEFTWELPWSDLNVRSAVKKTRFIQIDSEGTASFTVSMYTDRITTDNFMVDTPQLSADFVGGGVSGYGGENPTFGGGRVSSDEKMFSWPAKFKFMKLKFTGTAESELSFTAITLLYQKGSVYLG